MGSATEKQVAAFERAAREKALNRARLRRAREAEEANEPKRQPSKSATERQAERLTRKSEDRL